MQPEPLIKRKVLPDSNEVLRKPVTDAKPQILSSLNTPTPLSPLSVATEEADFGLLATPSQSNSSSTTRNRRATVSTPPSYDQLPDTHDKLLNQSTHAYDDQSRAEFVKWGVSLKTPILMAGFLCCGIALAVGHHMFYMSLDGKPAGTKSRQQWATVFGTLFSFLVIVSLKTASNSAYQQHIWTVFKRKPLALGTLDRLFSLTSDPTGFLRMPMIRNAKVGSLMAAICWCLPLAGVTPPATLAVVPGIHNESIPSQLPTVSWSLTDFWYNPSSGNAYLPSPEMMNVARTAASSISVLPPLPPIPNFANISFDNQFYGPSVQCAMANETQKANFYRHLDSWARVCDISSFPTVSEQTLNVSSNCYGDSSGTPDMLMFSMFDPLALEPEDTNFEEDSAFEVPPEQFMKTFFVDGSPADRVDLSELMDSSQGLNSTIVAPQLWIQTANESLICVMTNASFEVYSEFVNGAPTEISYDIKHSQIFWLPLFLVMLESLDYSSRQLNPSIVAYKAVFDSLSTLLNGNISLSIYDSSRSYIPGVERIAQQTSDILQTGLGACDDFLDNFWNNHEIGVKFDYSGVTDPPSNQTSNQTVRSFVPWRQAFTSNQTELAPQDMHTRKWEFISNQTALPQDITKYSIGGGQTESQKCRKKTLLHAVEDLMNNITVSLLNEPSFISYPTDDIDVTHFRTVNIYEYNSRNLILSYSIALGFTLFTISIGFYALHSNGVAHSTSFSALITTTRNARLDELSRGHSLGALPLDQRVLKTKLRFGELHEGGGEWGVGETHLGFGFAENVGELKQKGRYV